MKTLRNLNLGSDRNSYVVAVAIALLIASIMFGVYYAVLRPTPDRYLTIYVLDTQNRAENYPERLASGVNSTFSVYVDVENHMGAVQNCTVMVKVTQNANPSFPLPDTALDQPPFNELVQDGAKWENTATVSLDTAGNYMVVFELWTYNSGTGKAEFSGVFTVLNVQVV